MSNVKPVLCAVLVFASGVLVSAQAEETAPAAPAVPANFTAPQSLLAAYTPYEREILGELIASSAFWPKKVAIRQALDYDILKDGEPIGTAKVPAGTELTLVNVKPDGVTVALYGSKRKLSFAETDIVTRYPQAKADAEKKTREEMAALAALANVATIAQQTPAGPVTAAPDPSQQQRPVVEYVENVIGYGSPYDYYYYSAPIYYPYPVYYINGGYCPYPKPLPKPNPPMSGGIRSGQSPVQTHLPGNNGLLPAGVRAAQPAR
jgi:hypothetical protein